MNSSENNQPQYEIPVTEKHRIVDPDKMVARAQQLLTQRPQDSWIIGQTLITHSWSGLENKYAPVAYDRSQSISGARGYRLSQETLPMLIIVSIIVMSMFGIVGSVSIALFAQAQDKTLLIVLIAGLLLSISFTLFIIRKMFNGLYTEYKEGKRIVASSSMPTYINPVASQDEVKKKTKIAVDQYAKVFFEPVSSNVLWQDL